MDKLLLIDDEEDVQYSFRRIFDSADIAITTADSGEHGLALLPQVKPDLVIMDIRMAGLNGLETLRRIRETDTKLPVIMMTAYGTTQTAIEAMKLGAYDYLLKPFDVPKLKQIVFGALKAARDMRQVVSLDAPFTDEDAELGIVGQSEPMQAVYKLIGQLAASDATALITGESGTGKELVARAIYSHSRRANQPFIAINCAAIPENLLESELFGHERGSFTGASERRIGKFEQCNHGTIFLDEIGDMTPPTQTKILRVLQSGTFERVGGNTPIQVDVRVIAATNKPLEEAVKKKEFREDLFYRLNVVRIELPPMRERPEDIALLAPYFLRKFARAQSTKPRHLSADALAALRAYAWPGNVRELENVMQRAQVIAKGDAILLRDLPPVVVSALQQVSLATAVAPGSTTESSATVAGAASAYAVSAEPDVKHLGALLFNWARKDKSLKVIPAVERELVIQALADTNGNQVQSAKLLGMTRATLRKRIQKYGIKRELTIE